MIAFFGFFSPPPPGAEVWLGGEGFCGPHGATYQFPLELLLPKRSECVNFINPVVSWIVFGRFVYQSWLSDLKLESLLS